MYSTHVRLGDVVVDVLSDDQTITGSIATPFQSAYDANHPVIERTTVNVDDSYLPHDSAPDKLRKAVLKVIQTAMLYHRNYLYFDASGLVDTRGKALVLAGESKSGKSTLVAALSLTGHRKIFFEDLALVRPNEFAPIRLPVPVRLRDGTSALLKAELNLEVPVDSLVGRRYLSAPENDEPIRQVSITRIVHLGGFDDGPVKLIGISAEEGLRRLLPVSNAAILRGGVDWLWDCVRSLEHMILSGGQLKSRMERLNTLE